jgi:mono/diheme cytochrome c family protein
MFQVTQDEDMRAFALWSVVVIVTMVGCTILEPDETGEGDVELARGEDLYRANCMDCHGGATGGDITDVPPPHNAEGHTWHHGDCELVEMTRQGMPARPGSPADTPAMPAFADELSEDDIEAILAYIRTWWTPEQREHQERVTEQVC